MEKFSSGRNWTISQAQPATEPLTISELREHCRVIPLPGSPEQSPDDPSLLIYGKAARAAAEEILCRPIVQRLVTLKTDSFSREMLLPVFAVQSIVSVEYVDRDGDTQTIDPQEYGFWQRNGFVYLYFVKSFAIPQVQDEPDSVIVKVMDGYPSEESPPGADQVPDDVKAAMLLYAGTLFEHRESVAVGTIANEVPMTTRDLLWPHRVVGI